MGEEDYTRKDNHLNRKIYHDFGRGRVEVASGCRARICVGYKIEHLQRPDGTYERREVDVFDTVFG